MERIADSQRDGGQEAGENAASAQDKPVRTFKPGWRRMWRSAGVRRLVVIFLLAFGTAALLLWAYSAYSADRLRKEWIARETAALGALAARDPALAEAWARQLGAGDATPAEAAIGRELAARYGIDGELDAALVPLVERRRSREWPLLAVGVFGLLAALLLALLRESRQQLAEVRGLAGSLEAAVKENRPMKFRIYAEGELGLLAHQVQELSLRLQETIAQLSRDKDFLRDTIADISHQLKTPLASLTVYVELLQGGGIGPAEQEEFLRTCARELERMDWLIQMLLKLARLEAGSLPMQLERAPMADTVRMATHAIGRLAEERKVEISLDGPAEPVVVPHDPRWLSEALANLVKNAVEHSPPSGVVKIAWETTPIFVRLRVTDQGAGIDARDEPHIFKKFYRAASGQAGGSGVGLGLPLAKTIAERHGGMLSAGKAEGGGTVFTLTLPLTQLPVS
ncbi:sensor histidine kinase [Cohnella hashimotonis]|uniref:histidine kinase n=1 Tax=Cohnella hashimotonis TaxID=2826895 RepID=A0ABT6TU11_9BACL|nr:ATP-binding protein [Cohnella hashimotonis]MDI4649272.1 ATP-binding protein [Cohnella hashimotonis]